MRAQGSGAIVNCSSLGGLVGRARAAPHTTPQTRSHRPYQKVAREYAPRGVRINAVCPGTIETPMVTT